MKSIVVVFFLCIFTFNLFSQTIKDTVEIKEVTITGSKSRKKDKSLVPMQTLSRIELDKISGVSAADAVKNFSGITIKDYGGLGGLKTVMVRSLGANHTGVFIDGVQFSDAATGQIDLGRISTENAGEISLFIGQPSSLCQPARYYASASVISIQSLAPIFVHKNYSFKASYKTGSFGLKNTYFSLQNKYNHQIYSHFSCTYVNANGEYPYRLQYGSSLDTTLWRNNSDIESININFSFTKEFSDSSKMLIKSYYYWSNRGLPGAVVYYNPFSSQRLWNMDFFTNLQYKTKETKRLQWLSNLKYSQNRLRYLDPEYLNQEGKLDNQYLQQEYYLSQAMLYKITDSLNFSIALDLFLNSLSANLYQYAQPVRLSSLSSFSINYALRKMKINSSVLATSVREKTLTGEAAPSRNELSPSFSLGYKLFNQPSLLFRFLYKDIFRMPTFNDLYYTLLGNNHLKPEFTKQYNLGFTGSAQAKFLHYISFKADVFYNRITDKIVAIPTKNLFVWSMHNIGIVETKGFEVQTHFITKPFLQNWKLSLQSNYTFQKAIDVTHSLSTSYKQQIPYMPYETFSTMFSIDYKKISLNYNFLFNGFRYILGENTYQNMIEAWKVTDISILSHFKIKKNDVKFKIEISNLFNKQYEVIKSFPMPGRAFYFTFTLSNE